MRKLYSEIKIDAPLEIVWQILTTFGRYPRWNPYFREIDGTFDEGANLRIQTDTSGLGDRSLKARLIHIEPGREFTFASKLFITGLFEEHFSFTVEQVNPQSVKVIHSEFAWGLLTPVLWHWLKRDTIREMGRMDSALKHVCERSTSSAEALA